MKPMASNRANPSISLDDQVPLSTSGKQVPAALSMMVDSMTSMVERAKTDLENVDQRARADQKARKDIAILDKRARADHDLLIKVRKAKELTS